MEGTLKVSQENRCFLITSCGESRNFFRCPVVSETTRNVRVLNNAHYSYPFANIALREISSAANYLAAKAEDHLHDPAHVDVGPRAQGHPEGADAVESAQSPLAPAACARREFLR